MTTEQSYWMALIFGMTYQSSMAWTIYWNFPNFWEIDFDDMQKWNVDNLQRQRYARDTKYNKGRVTDQTRSLREIIGPHGSIENFFKRLVVEGDEQTSFESCFNAISTFYKYGRMTSWLTCQNLFEICNLPIRPNSMLATDPSNWSVRSGIMYLYNREDMVEAKCKEKVTFTKEDKKWIAEKEVELYQEALTHIDEDKRHIFSNYLLESHLCQYKKLLTGGDYGGHSSGDHVSRCAWLKERWPEVNYDAFYKNAITKHHPLVRMKRESPALRKLCGLTGQVINMHQDFDDLPDMYKELDLDESLLYNPENDPVVESKVELYTEKLFGRAPAEADDTLSYFGVKK